MTGYRVEYANSGRAKCNGRKPCKGTAIGKGEIRFGTWVTLQEHGSFKWRHWGCLTSSVLKNVADELDSQIDGLDGLEDLKPEDQIKIKKAFEEGFIDPADVPSTAVPEKADEPKTETKTKDENSVADANPKKRKRAPANKKPKSSEVVNDNDENQGPEDPTEGEKPKTQKKKKQVNQEKKVTEGKKKKTASQAD